MKHWAEWFYKSRAWQECRDAYFISQYGLCERCARPGEIVHHKIKLTPANINNTEVTLNWDLLELLCIPCHNSIHGLSSTSEETMFDDEGNLVKK